jgi:hypothetical protein
MALVDCNGGKLDRVAHVAAIAGIGERSLLSGKVLCQVQQVFFHQ